MTTKTTTISDLIDLSAAPMRGPITPTALPDGGEPVTVVISRLVRPGHEAEFETLITALTKACLAEPGYLGCTVQRPPVIRLTDDGYREYVSEFRFATVAQLREFERGPIQARFMADIAPHVAGEELLSEETGIESWFRAEPVARDPVRWRITLVTIAVVFALVMPLARLIGLVLGDWPLWAQMLLAVVIQSILMTYWLMPRVIGALSGWLYLRRRRRAAVPS